MSAFNPRTSTTFRERCMGIHSTGSSTISFRGEARRFTEPPADPGNDYPATPPIAEVSEAYTPVSEDVMADAVAAIVDSVPSVAVATEPVAEVPTATVVDYDAMNRATLRVEAKRLNIVGAQRLLLAPLRDAVKAAAAAERVAA